MSLAVQPESLLVIGGRAVTLEWGSLLPGWEPKQRFCSVALVCFQNMNPKSPTPSQNLAERLGMETGVSPVALREVGHEKIVTFRQNGKLWEFRVLPVRRELLLVVANNDLW
jgi:hypothetical protein